MKILVAAAAFSSEMSGLQRHAFNMVRCLLLRPEIEAIHLVAAPWQRELVLSAGLGSDKRLAIHIAEMGRGSVGRNGWYYLRLPEMAASLGVDLVHLTYPMPVNADAYACPTVVTLHDLYPYEAPLNFGFPKFVFNRQVLQQCLAHVNAIACVSETTRQRLRQYVPARVWDKSACVYNCVESTQPNDAQALSHDAPWEWQGEPFLLCVAQHRRNKNIPLLIRVFARLLSRGQIDQRTKLVVVGIEGPETRLIHRTASEFGVSGDVKFFEGLTEAQLRWCYANCEALAVPSSIEGFGLPVAEALMAGCKVVCSDIAAHREVGGEHCRFAALHGRAEETLAEAIVETMRKPRIKPIVFPQFSAAVIAEQYVALYRRLLSAPALRQRKSVAVAATAASERRVL